MEGPEGEEEEKEEEIKRIRKKKNTETVESLRARYKVDGLNGGWAESTLGLLFW